MIDFIGISIGFIGFPELLVLGGLSLGFILLVIVIMKKKT